MAVVVALLRNPPRHYVPIVPMAVHHRGVAVPAHILLQLSEAGRPLIRARMPRPPRLSFQAALPVQAESTSQVRTTLVVHPVTETDPDLDVAGGHRRVSMSSRE